MKSAYTAVRRAFHESDSNFPLSEKRLLKHLAIEKAIIPSSTENNTTVKKIAGKNHRVVVFKRSALFDPEDDEKDDEEGELP